MQYKFSKDERETLEGLSLDFDPMGDLTEDEEMLLLELIEDAAALAGYDTDAGEKFNDILDTMAKQSW